MGTTIAVSTDILEKLKEFGNKGETYNNILARLLESARERQLQEILMSEKGCVTLEEARARLKKRTR